MTPSVQSQEVKRMAREMRKLRKQKDPSTGKQVTWRTVAFEFSVRDKSGKPSPGLAYQIAEKEYMPSLELCKRLHIQVKVCPQCGQKIRVVKPEYIKRAIKFLKERDNDKR